MDPADTSRKKQLITALAVLLAIVIIVGATVVANNNKKSGETAGANTTTNSESSNTGQESSGSDTPAGSSSYKDGTYNADATYQSPGGTEEISVEVTLKDGVVTSSSVTTNPTESEAEEYQNMFTSSYKSQVVGKSIDSISLSRVSGSSLTSEGFNSAIDKIQQQAQS